MTIFRQVAGEELPTLQNLLRQLLPRSAQMLNVVSLSALGKIPKSTTIDLFVYGNEDSNGKFIWNDELFLLCIHQPIIQGLYSVMIHAPPNPTEEMIKTLDQFLEWDKIKLFSSVNQSFFDNHLKSLCMKNGDISHNPDGLPCESSLALDIDPDFESVKMELAENVEIKELSPEDSWVMTRNYSKWAKPHTRSQIENTIRALTSAGVYINGELVSSAVFSQIGLINVLFTEESVRGKGYGSMILKSLRNKILSMGFIPVVEFEVYDPTSKGPIRRSGFESVGYVNWIKFRRSAAEN